MKIRKHLIPKKSKIAISLLFGFFALPVISAEFLPAELSVLEPEEVIIDESEQFNPEGVVTGRNWASLYRSSDNSSQLLPYTIVDGMAIHEGDIILGTASDLEDSPVSTNNNIQQGVATSSLGRRWMDGWKYTLCT